MIKVTMGRLTSTYMCAHMLNLLSTACFTSPVARLGEPVKVQRCGKWFRKAGSNTEIMQSWQRPKDASVPASQHLGHREEDCLMVIQKPVMWLQGPLELHKKKL